MTNIKCSYDCVFQSGGLCNYETIHKKELNSETDCIYYEKRHTN